MSASHPRPHDRGPALAVGNAKVNKILCNFKINHIHKNTRLRQTTVIQWFDTTGTIPVSYAATIGGKWGHSSTSSGRLLSCSI